jgi:hypothetical protein
MTMTAKHLKVSSKSDGADASRVRPSDWNADHVIIGWRPNALTAFTDLTGQALGSVITSNSITLATSDDSNAAADRVFGLCVRGDGSPQIELNGNGIWATGHLARTGDTVKLRLTSSGSPSTARTATLYADGRSTTWTVTTTAFAFPTVSNSRLWLSRDRKIYTDTGGSTPAGIGDSIARWDAVGGSWGTDSFTQSTAGYRPTLQSDGVKSDGSDDFLAPASNINVTGDFTFYWVQSSSSSTHAIGLAGDGSVSNFDMLGCDHSADLNYVIDTSIGITTNTPDRSYCIRRIRRSSGTLYYKRPGTAEASAGGATGTIRIGTLLARFGNVVYSASTSRFHQFVLVTSNLTPGGADDLAIISALQSLESSVTGP